MAACFDLSHPDTPERPEKVKGPEIGALMRYRSKYEQPDRVVKVIARSYVWSPEQHNPDGTHGFRRYDWTVIQRGPKSGQHLVVDDVELFPIEPGDVVTPKEV